ncbi:SRPBCC family protein [Bdellovibrionota bacterium FG-1]
MSRPTPPPSTDSQKTAELRAKLDQILTHPGLIEASVYDGQVFLAGSVFDDEVHSILEIAKKLVGVTPVIHHLEVMNSSSDKPSSGHLPENRFGYQPGFIAGRWAPWLRALAGLSGVMIMIQGFRTKEKKAGLGSLLSLGIGGLLLSRAMTNRDITQVIGSLILPVIQMKRTLSVSTNVEEAYSFWSQFKNYPRFMSFIRDVQINDSGVLRWAAKAPGGAQVHWETSVFDLIPNQRIAWKSIPGSLIATEGSVQFESIETGGTRLHIELSYAPPAGALGYLVARLLGFDPRDRIDQDLEVMKLLLQHGQPSARSPKMTADFQPTPRSGALSNQQNRPSRMAQ